MALATRELELVIIAKDRASAVLARVGGALAILGGGAARLGAEGIEFFADATLEAIEFRRSVALAFTQANIAGLEFNDILNLIRNTARNSAVPIEELSEATFDIFSTITLDNIDQARGLLETASMSATAGQAPLRDITRAMLAWLNALEMTPTVENATKILDTQFKLVEFGAGTYTEFADVIGLAIPAFVSAGQGVDELAGSIAFLSRNGQDAAQASAAARRGIELLFSPKAIKGLRNLGIEVEDNNGNFRLLDDLLADVVEEFRGLSDAERKLQFQEIFGTGSIQARRFFDLILAEGNFEEFLAIMGEVRGGAGAVAEAFDIMTAEPAVQLDMLKNRFVVLRQEIGDAFIPFLTGKLFPVLDRLLDWWEDLDEIQRNNIVQWAAFATLFVTIGGTLAAAVGAGILFLGVLQAFVGSFGLALLLGGGVVTIISALAAAIALAVIDWELFVEIFNPWWERAITLMEPVLDWIETNFPGVWEGVLTTWERLPAIWDQLVHMWTGKDFGNEIDDLPQIVQDIVFAIGNIGLGIIGFADMIRTAFTNIKTWFNENLREPFEGFISFVQEQGGLIMERLTTIFDQLGPELLPIWNQLKEEFGPTMEELILLAISIGEAVVALAALVIGAVALIWDKFGENIVENLRILVETIGGLFRGMAKIARGWVDVITGVITLDLEKASSGLAMTVEGQKDIMGVAWNTIADTVVNSTDTQKNALSSLTDHTYTELQQIENGWDRARRNIQSDIWAIHNTFPVMNPGSPFSPPMTEQIRDSLMFIRAQYESQTRAIERTVSRSGHRMRDQFAAFNPNAEFAFGGVGSRPQGPATTIGTQIDRQVVVEQVNSQADAREIASEIAWQALNS